ncbi:MAG TPA: pantoate--beta-alanine ligase [Candidatus Polarisedimenticolaceae bacterium]|nr:pantoate--beta-alanine ligase [Candidatus Polarisedimenticolaceae bacterium]
MDVVRRVHGMREVAARARSRGERIGLVPTMGYLHEGHLALARRIRAHVDVTVVSIFVNPTQFGPGEDFARYPRDLARDCDLLAAEGVDVVFAPEADEIYPAGVSTFVEVAGISDVLEGKSRPGHFRGVATVVLKLFEVVKPQVAIFGQKDAQQVAVVTKMARDLLLDVEILVLPTKRDEDGLALSSRNVYLSADERRAASAIPRALEAARAALAEGATDPDAILAAARAPIDAEPLLRIDYIALVDAESFEPVARAQGDLLLVAAVFAGTTRLIDNLPLRA